MTRPNIAGAIRYSTLYVLAAALAAGLGLWSAQRYFASPIATLPALRAVTVFPTTRALPPYRLDASDGGKITLDGLRGHWTLVYLGFTRCPDVCPTTLQTLGLAAKAWAGLPATIRPRVLFVSVDPDRDSPQHAGEYAHYFGKDFLAATSDAKTLDAFARSLGMVFMKVSIANGKDYTIDHSASISLVDPEGRMAGLIRPAPPPAQPFDPDAIGADMKALAESAAR